jgi:LCP family protein required for cell wall assembly
VAEDDEATRVIRRPAGAQRDPSGENVPRGAGASPGDGSTTIPRITSRVYGRPRPGREPVRPLRRSGRGDGGAGSGGRPALGMGGGRSLGKVIRTTLVCALVLLLVFVVGGYFWIGSRLTTTEAFSDYPGRPEETPGTDWLLVGSDSREGLTAAERKRLATGSVGGRRTDTVMLLHIPRDGRPTLVSLPRDSYVPIDGHGRNKLNAAYAFGGPELLVKTVEQVTGIRIDHYMEIGFGGFVDIVDAIGGVEICVKQNIKDPKAGINLKKGCQVMDGGTALGYVRTRATGAIPDLERTQRQRQFLAALVSKAASPGTLLNPFSSVPLALSAADAVTVDPGTGPIDLLRLALAMRDKPISTAVPIGALPTINGMAVVKWDTEKALRLFNALKEDRPVPKDVLSNK